MTFVVLSLPWWKIVVNKMQHAARIDGPGSRDVAYHACEQRFQVPENNVCWLDIISGGRVRLTTCGVFREIEIESQRKS